MKPEFPTFISLLYLASKMLNDILHKYSTPMYYRQLL